MQLEHRIPNRFLCNPISVCAIQFFIYSKLITEWPHHDTFQTSHFILPYFPLPLSLLQYPQDLSSCNSLLDDNIVGFIAPWGHLGTEQGEWKGKETWQKELPAECIWGELKVISLVGNPVPEPGTRQFRVPGKTFASVSDNMKLHNETGTIILIFCPLWNRGRESWRNLGRSCIQKLMDVKQP